jgi:hypothetical protein
MAPPSAKRSRNDSTNSSQPLQTKKSKPSAPGPRSGFRLPVNSNLTKKTRVISLGEGVGRARSSTTPFQPKQQASIGTDTDPHTSQLAHPQDHAQNFDAELPSPEAATTEEAQSMSNGNKKPVYSNHVSFEVRSTFDSYPTYGAEHYNRTSSRNGCHSARNVLMKCYA